MVIVFAGLIAGPYYGLKRAAPWTFSPPTAGRALQTGGWTVDYPLGTVNASPEFNFPLQLVYLTTRSQEGLFGSGWFCPQLESSILPVGKGVLLMDHALRRTGRAPAESRQKQRIPQRGPRVEGRGFSQQADGDE